MLTNENGKYIINLTNESEVKIMLKIIVEIKENKQDNGETSNVTLKAMNNLDKATENEKATGNVVYNTIAEALNNLKENQ